MKRLVVGLKAGKAMRRLPEDVRAQLMAKLERYAQTGVGDVKALKGMIGFRLRAGDYRVLLEVDDAIVDVRDVGHRRDTYR